MNNELESKILCREIGNLVGPLAGIGARWAARRLPSVAHEFNGTTHLPSDTLFEIAFTVLKQLGKEERGHQTHHEGFVIVGSGIQDMNPTLVRVSVTENTSGSSLQLRAVAKEGAIPQRSAELAIEKVLAALKIVQPSLSFQVTA